MFVKSKSDKGGTVPYRSVFNAPKWRGLNPLLYTLRRTYSLSGADVFLILHVAKLIINPYKLIVIVNYLYFIKDLY